MQLRLALVYFVFVLINGFRNQNSFDCSHLLLRRYHHRLSMPRLWPVIGVFFEMTLWFSLVRTAPSCSGRSVNSGLELRTLRELTAYSACSFRTCCSARRCCGLVSCCLWPTCLLTLVQIGFFAAFGYCSDLYHQGFEWACAIAGWNLSLASRHFRESLA